MLQKRIISMIKIKYSVAILPFIGFFIVSLAGCSSVTPQVRETINDTSVLNKKFIKGVTTKEDVLKFFGGKPDLISDEEAKNLGYYEEWTYLVSERTSSSKIADFFGGEVISKVIGKDIGESKGYCLSLFFDENGYLQDYKIHWSN